MSNDLADLIAKELAAYSDEVTEEVDKIAEQVADETVDELKETSPKRYGKYRRSWKKKKLEKEEVGQWLFCCVQRSCKSYSHT
ncbi:HK97 gp10 family phage protein [Streptococcus pneumoniae]|nr:HK97 gp10 family phage protein [Streptococcus pneumoniae]